MTDEHLIWKEISRQKIADSPIFDLFRARRRAADGSESNVVLLEAPDWVTIVPRLTIDNEEHFLMVRQYRHGSGTVTVEFPAGAVDPGEPAEQAARRELLEETGYRAGKLTKLGSVNPNPAFLTNSFHAFIAEDLQQIQPQKLDEHEFVDYLTLPVTEVEKRMGTGEYNNGTMLMALLYYQRWKKA